MTPINIVTLLLDKSTYSVFLNTLYANDQKPVCAHYTYNSFSLAKDYPFANMPMFPCCTSEKRLEQQPKNTIYPCAFDVNSQIGCSYYNPDVYIIASEIYENSFGLKEQVDLIRSRSPQFGWTYYIYNPISSVIHEKFYFSVLSIENITEEQADEKAFLLYNQFIETVYSLDVTSLVKSSDSLVVHEETKKNSFLLSLVSSEQV